MGRTGSFVGGRFLRLFKWPLVSDTRPINRPSGFCSYKDLPSHNRTLNLPEKRLKLREKCCRRETKCSQIIVSFYPLYFFHSFDIVISRLSHHQWGAVWGIDLYVHKLHFFQENKETHGDQTITTETQTHTHGATHVIYTHFTHTIWSLRGWTAGWTNGRWLYKDIQVTEVTVCVCNRKGIICL